MTYDSRMEKRSVVALAITLFFCSPQTKPVVSIPTVAVPTVSGVRNAEAATIDSLLQTRLDSAKSALTLTMIQYDKGAATFDDVVVWSERFFQAQRDALSGPQLAVAARERLATLKQLESSATQRYLAGAATQADTVKATYLRATAEWELSRLPSN
jgi:hypothetical protein